jgi:hypothetical protein
MLFVLERRRSRRLQGAIRAERALASGAIKYERALASGAIKYERALASGAIKYGASDSERSNQECRGVVGSVG